ncbi:MAG: hypothetical protein Q9195_002387 [Heterodermia aff. obscurata]
MTLQHFYTNGLPSIPSLPVSSLTANGVLIIIAIYCVCQILKFDPFKPQARLFWDCLVFLTPEKLISVLHPAYNSLDGSDSPVGLVSSSSKIRARKSEAIRKILGLDNTGTLTTAQGSQSLPVPLDMAAIPSKAPPGLGNWDNSCYQNCILQGLASLRSLPGYLDQGISNEEEPSTGVAMKHLVNRLNNPSNAGKMLWTPAELKNMSSWQQQDAQEYFSKVLDEIDKDVSQSAATRSRNPGLKALVGLEPEPEADNLYFGAGNLVGRRTLHGLPDELNDLMARNPLEGLLAQRVGCLRCRYVDGLSLIPFNCLTVTLGRHWIYDVRTCLDEYTTLEPINGVECAKCTLLREKQQYESLLEQFETMTAVSPLPGALKDSLEERLASVDATLDSEDFSDTALKKCEIPVNSRVSTTKSRQAVIARVPESLVIHINRSVFNEMTGAQRKNFADVRFPEVFDLSPWCLGSDVLPDLENSKTLVEEWIDDPAKSMLSPGIRDVPAEYQMPYQLRAVVTHSGRHENGHYICYRKYASPTTSGDGQNEKPVEKWWRLSDEAVSEVSEDHVLSQGGVFMLFYERVAHPQLPKRVDTKTDIPTDAQHLVSTEPTLEEVLDESEDLVPLLVSTTASAEAPSVMPIPGDETDLSTSESQAPAASSDDHMSEISSPTSNSSSPATTPKLEDAPKQNRKVTPAMRTAPPRKGSMGMGQVSSMISAN